MQLSLRRVRRRLAIVVAVLAVSQGPASFAENADQRTEAALLLGAWDCTASNDGSTSEQNYRRVDDSTLALATVVQAPRTTGARTLSGNRAATITSYGNHAGTGTDTGGTRTDPAGTRTDPAGTRTDPAGTRTDPGDARADAGANAADNGTQTETFDETLTYGSASGMWSLDAGTSRSSDSEHLEAPAWQAGDWTFSGTEKVARKSRPVRVVYSYVPPDTYVRAHQVLSGNRWNDDETEVCRRAPLEANYDAGFPPPGDGFVPAIGSVTARSASPSPSPAAAGPGPATATPKTAAASPVSSSTPEAASSAVALSAPKQPSAVKPQANVVDRAFALTQGVWDCKTFGGADATHTYTRDGNDTIKLHNVLRIANHDYAIDESYRFDAAKERWTTVTSGSAYSGVAGRWISDDWVFVGDMPLGGKRVPVEMVYSRLGDRAFRRDFIRVQNGDRETFAAETCRQR